MMRNCCCRSDYFSSAGPGDGFTHYGVGLDVFHPVVVHDAEIAAGKGGGHGFGQFGLGFYHLCSGFLCLGFHLLLQGYGHGTALFGLGLCDVFVGLRLVYLQCGADILAYVYIGDVNRENLECRAAVKAFAEHEF